METALFQNVNTIVFYVLTSICIFSSIFSKQILEKITLTGKNSSNRLVFFFCSKINELILDSVFLKNKTTLIILFIILLFFKTETAIGFYWFPVALVIGIFFGILIATRDTEDIGYATKYVVPDIVYTISSICISTGMFLFFYKNNLICGSVVNITLTALLYFMITEKSLFLGKYLLTKKQECTFSGEEQRLERHKK